MKEEGPYAHAAVLLLSKREAVPFPAAPDGCGALGSFPLDGRGSETFCIIFQKDIAYLQENKQLFYLKALRQTVCICTVTTDICAALLRLWTV